MDELENLENEELEEEVVEEEEVDTSEPLIEEPQEAEETVEETPRSEPGYVQGRIDKAVAKALQRERDAIRAEMEQQYAPIKERLLEMDAKELVRRGEVKDLETAKELVRYRQGQPPQKAEEPTPQVDPNSARIDARVEILTHQAKRIKETTGLDVMKEFDNNPEIKQKVIDGDMDFYEVAEAMKSKKRPPSPTRSPNGASGRDPNAIDKMSKDEFARLEKRISEGARISLR